MDVFRTKYCLSMPNIVWHIVSGDLEMHAVTLCVLRICRLMTSYTQKKQ